MVGVGCGHNQRYVNSSALQMEKSRASMQSNIGFWKFFQNGKLFFSRKQTKFSLEGFRFKWKILKPTPFVEFLFWK
jgi:hypothetical protein